MDALAALSAVTTTMLQPRQRLVSFAETPVSPFPTLNSNPLSPKGHPPIILTAIFLSLPLLQKEAVGTAGLAALSSASTAALISAPHSMVNRGRLQSLGE